MNENMSCNFNKNELAVNLTDDPCQTMSECELIELIGGNDFEKALAATKSSAATAIVLQFAVLDQDRLIRQAALRNPNISDELVIKLTDDIDIEIAKEAHIEAVRRNL